MVFGVLRNLLDWRKAGAEGLSILLFSREFIVKRLLRDGGRIIRKNSKLVFKMQSKALHVHARQT